MFWVPVPLPVPRYSDVSLNTVDDKRSTQQNVNGNVYVHLLNVYPAVPDAIQRYCILSYLVRRRVCNCRCGFSYVSNQGRYLQRTDRVTVHEVFVELTKRITLL
jgi:hypothetical protein